MKKQADYIKNIEIKGLWGRKNISWALRPDVNIFKRSERNRQEYYSERLGTHTRQTGGRYSEPTASNRE